MAAAGIKCQTKIVIGTREDFEQEVLTYTSGEDNWVLHPETFHCLLTKSEDGKDDLPIFSVLLTRKLSGIKKAGAQSFNQQQFLDMQYKLNQMAQGKS